MPQWPESPESLPAGHPVATVPTARPGRTGRLRLLFTVKDGRTVLTDGYAEPPFAIGRVFYPAGPALAHLILVQTTAGLFGGDVLSATIDVEPGARVVLTSQAAQKVHPSAEGEWARQQWHARVAAGGELHGYLEPIIPFAGARLDQRTRFEVARGAHLFWADGLMAGRVRREERWQFVALRTETALVRDEQLAFLDRASIGEDHAAADKPWAMDSYVYLGTQIACGVPGARDKGEALQASLFDGERADDVRGAVDAVEDDVLVGRALMSDGVSFGRLQRAWRRAVFEDLLGEPEPPLRP
ncbi:MAG TPA: urease accessory protein UreD [Vicinamibacterales bacterium]|jgi:urease accessory protein